MSKRENKQISATLATATCALLGSSLPTAVQAQEQPGWSFDTALLYYSEDNNRVQDYSLTVLAKRSFVDDRYLTLGLIVDSLTGATPIGAIRQTVPQTFTRPSGRHVFTVPANTLPLDDTFLDTRYALTANWEQPLGRLYKINVGASASVEYDYTHLGANAKIARDFNNRNTTLSAGIAYANDSMDPEGGAPIPCTPMLDVEPARNTT